MSLIKHVPHWKETLCNGLSIVSTFCIARFSKCPPTGDLVNVFDSR